MKKILALVLCLCCLLMLNTAALAAGELSITQKKLITTEGEASALFVAKVENVGDEGCYVDTKGKLVAFDANDDPVISEDYVSTTPSGLYLAPGEWAYVGNSLYESALKTSTVADYKFSLKTSEYGSKYEKLPCEGTIVFDKNQKYDNGIVVTFTNTGSEITGETVVVAALYDQNGELMFVNYDYNDSVGVHPGSTVSVFLNIFSDTVASFNNAGLTPTTVECFVYMEVEE